MEPSPSWEANTHSASQEIPILLRNSKVHHSVHISPPLIHILCQIYPVHIFSPHFSNIHSNIIFPSKSRSSERWSPAFTFSDLHLVRIFHVSHACCTSHPFYPPWDDYPGNAFFPSTSSEPQVIFAETYTSDVSAVWLPDITLFTAILMHSCLIGWFLCLFIQTAFVAAALWPSWGFDMQILCIHAEWQHN